MKKIPTLFLRDETDMSRVTRTVDPRCQWVVAGEGVPTQKRDGTAVRIHDGRVWKRYDYSLKRERKGITPPNSWTPCEPHRDPVSGHWPGWTICLYVGGLDPLIIEAAKSQHLMAEDGTYEACGEKINGNPERFYGLVLIRHGVDTLDDNLFPRDFDGLAAALRECPIEGIVWHHPNGRMAKIKARDFGIPWPRPESE